MQSINTNESTGAQRAEAYCSKHGKYLSTIIYLGSRRHQSPCPRCRGENINETNKKKKKSKDAMTMESALNREYRIAGIDKRFLDCDFENYETKKQEQKEALEKCKAYVDNFKYNFENGHSLMMLGNCGTGKNHLATCVSKELIKAKYKVIFCRVSDLMQEIKNAWKNNNAEEERCIYEKYKSYDLLVMDEVGLQYNSKAEKVVLYKIIDDRYRKCKPNIIIGNVNIEELNESLGEPVVDRLLDGCGEAINFNWESYRSNDKKERIENTFNSASKNREKRDIKL